MNQDDSFTALENVSLTELTGSQWDSYYSDMAHWLNDSDADIRKRAIDRLFTATLWAEPYTQLKASDSDITTAGDENRRLGWLLETIEAAQVQQPDLIDLALEHLNFEANESANPVLTQWMDKLQSLDRNGVDPFVVEGTSLLQQEFDEDSEADVARLLVLLDHPNDYVRACAARKLSAREGAALDATAMFDLISQKEIVRPGIAGAYWSDWHFCRDSLPINPIAWMMDILEQRQLPEPACLPFNGIDFYLHEICAYSPASVERMIQGGYIDLALETATETRGSVDGMEPFLRQLADHPDPKVHERARFHLAHYYCFLHPDDTSGLIHHWPGWSPEADMFSFHHGVDRLVWFIVFHPRARSKAFSDDLAWRLIDRALPKPQRGEPAPHPMQFGGDVSCEPYRLGADLMWHFASGASVELHGDPDTSVWKRITIRAHTLGSVWQPTQS